MEAEPTATLSAARSLDTDGDSDDEDFDPLAITLEEEDDDDASDGDGSDDDDGSDEDGFSDASGSSDSAARAAKASFLRSFGERPPPTDPSTRPEALEDDDANLPPLADAEMEEIFDSDMSDTDDDSDSDSDEDVSLVPEESNVLDASHGTGAIPGPDYSPSASAAAGMARERLNDTDDAQTATPTAASPSVSVIPRELFAYSPSLKKRAREEALENRRRGANARGAPLGSPGASAFDDPIASDAPGSDADANQMGTLDSDGDSTAGIAKRTRANLSLVDIDFDFIERMMPLPDEGDEGFQFFDDAEEYANFLSAINLDFEVGGEDAGAQADDEGGAAAGGNDGTKTRAVATLASDDDSSDDDDYAEVDPKAARVERRARKYREKEREAHQTVAGGSTELPEAQARKAGRRHPRWTYKPKIERPQYKERPVWSTVRTRRMRQAMEERVARQAECAGDGAPAAANDTGGTGGAALAAAATPAAPATRAPTAAAAQPEVPYRGEFTPAQIGELHKMIGDHVQLLLQTWARSAWDPTPASQMAARQTHLLIDNMLNVTKGRLMAKIRAREPPHAAACFERPKPKPRETRAGDVASLPEGDAPGATPGSVGAAERWWPTRPPAAAAVYTVLDAMPLRHAQRFLSDVLRLGPAAPVPPGPRVPLPPERLQNGEELSEVERELRRDRLDAMYGRLSELFRPEKGAEGGVSGSTGTGTGDRTTPVPEGSSDASAAARVRRRPTPLEMVPEMVRLPKGVIDASRALAPWMNPECLPREPELRISFSKASWLPSEDALLATGILNYGLRWEAVRQNLLPAKTVEQINQRQKNLCNATRFKGDNEVREAKQRVLQPLNAREIAMIRDVLVRDGAVAGSEDWPKICQEKLPWRHASCLDRLWKDAHPEGLRAYEKYTLEPDDHLIADAEDAARGPGAGDGVAEETQLAGRAADPSRRTGGNNSARPGVAGITMIHSSFHDHNVSIHAPQRPRVTPSAANAPARLHPSLFGEDAAAALEEDEQAGDSAVAPAEASPMPSPARGEPSLLPSPMGDFRASDVAFSRVLFSPSKLPAALRESPRQKSPRFANREVEFEREEMSDSDDEDERGGNRRRGRGRPSKAAIAAAEKAEKAAKARIEREALPSSSDDESDGGGVEREEIESSDESEGGGADRSDLEDSDDEGGARGGARGAGAMPGAMPTGANAPLSPGVASVPPAAPSSGFGFMGSLDSTHAPEAALAPATAGAPTTMRGVAAAINDGAFGRVPLGNVGGQGGSLLLGAEAGGFEWSKERDHAILFTAQTKGAKTKTWRALSREGGACAGATAAGVKARFEWLCARARNQACAQPRGKKPTKKPSARLEGRT